MTAKDSGMHIYGMTVMIQKECLLKAARAFLVFREVEAFGEILVYRPSSQDIEDESLNRNSAFMSHHRKALTRSRTLQRMFPRLKMPLEKN